MNYLVVDTETGGLDPQKHSLLQIAAVWLRDGRIGSAIGINIAHDDYVVTQEALKVNNINLAEHTGRTPEGALETFIDFIQPDYSEKIILAGNNVHFDADFMKVWMGEKFHHLFSHRYLDLTSLIYADAETSPWPGGCGYNLEGALKRFNIVNTAPHTALGDAMATAKALSMMLYGVWGLDVK